MEQYWKLLVTKKKRKKDVATSPKKYLVATFSFSFYFGPIFHVNLNEVNI
jgi:hypothetical protein